MRVRFDINEIIKATGAHHPSRDEAGRMPASVSGVSIDSRTAEPGDMFVALKGNRFDGHDYIAEAFSRGVLLAIVSEQWLGSEKRAAGPEPLLGARDTLAAFQELGKYHRIRTNPKVVAVTGSSGKTTTKDMIASVSSTCYRTAKTQGNPNNQFG
ncbi:MAG: Mur ligase domain-containing protein, partial [Candidatus Eisenbacteria bacterium]